MKKYKIVWKSEIYGESVVDAIDEKESRRKANNDEDYDFEELEFDNDWEVCDVIEIK